MHVPLIAVCELISTSKLLSGGDRHAWPCVPARLLCARSCGISSLSCLASALSTQGFMEIVLKRGAAAVGEHHVGALMLGGARRGLQTAQQRELMRPHAR